MKMDKVKDYIAYLERYCKMYNVTKQEANKHFLCREVAKGYGLSEEEIDNMEL